MKLEIYDVLGFAAFAANVWGNLLLTSKRPFGWWIRIVSIILWGAYAWQNASIPMLLNAATFLCINCYGLWKWRKEAVAQGIRT